jgi:hypothetical protein
MTSSWVIEPESFGRLDGKNRDAWILLPFLYTKLEAGGIPLGHRPKVGLPPRPSQCIQNQCFVGCLEDQIVLRFNERSSTRQIRTRANECWWLGETSFNGGGLFGG